MYFRISTMLCFSHVADCFLHALCDNIHAWSVPKAAVGHCCRQPISATVLADMLAIVCSCRLLLSLRRWLYIIKRKLYPNVDFFSGELY